MLPVKSLLVPQNTYDDSVRAILRSTLEAVEAKYGMVCLINNGNGSPESYVSHRSLPDRKAGASVARWVATHGEPLALATREEALLIPDLVINKSEALPLICVPIQVNGTIVGAIQSNFPSLAKHEELVQKQPTLKLSASTIGHVIENAALQCKLEGTRALLRKMSNICLEIQEAEREPVILEVHDGPRSSNRCLGLYSMCRRAKFLEGTFKINSSLGKGTEILVDIPWSTDEE